MRDNEEDIGINKVAVEYGEEEQGGQIRCGKYRLRERCMRRKRIMYKMESKIKRERYKRRTKMTRMR